jgi:NADH-quinone oxidoreductase subunit L
VYFLVLFVPLIGAMVAGLLGRKIGERGVGILTSSCLIISLSWCVLIFYETILSSSTTHIKL